MNKPLNPRLLASILALAGVLAAPAFAHAQSACAQWDVSQPWRAMQGHHEVGFWLQQHQSRVSGSGEFWAAAGFGWQVMQIKRSGAYRVTGSLQGDTIELETQWGGVYIGKIDATGRIDGHTYDKRDSTSSARWYSDRRMNCLARVGEIHAQTGRPPPTPVPAVPAAPTPITETRPAVLTSGSKSHYSSKFGSIFGRDPASGSAPAPAPAPAPRPAQVDAPANPTAATCATGYVWRETRPIDQVCVTPESRTRVGLENRTQRARRQPGGGAYGPSTCRPGFVWREAYAGDTVCVAPEVRTLVREENALAATRLAPLPGKALNRQPASGMMASIRLNRPIYRGEP